MPLVSVIIPNHNGVRFLEECLESLRKQTFEDFEVIVVDNASTDGSVEIVRKIFPEARVFKNPRNLGFGGGINTGLRHAEGRLIALLNNDAVADANWLLELVSASNRSEGDFGIWASKILSAESPGTIDTAGHLLFPDGLNIGRGKGEADAEEYNREEEVLIASGCAAMFLKMVFDHVGDFDEEFFAYGDDTEMGLRARLSGWRCLYVPTSVVYHKGSATMGRYSADKVYLIERNRVWVLIKCFPSWRILISPFYTAQRLCYHVAASVSGKGAAGRLREGASFFSLVIIYFRANIDAIKGIGSMLSKRRRIDTLRKVPWREFSLWLGRFGISASEIAYKE